MIPQLRSAALLLAIAAPLFCAPSVTAQLPQPHPATQQTAATAPQVSGVPTHPEPLTSRLRSRLSSPDLALSLLGAGALLLLLECALPGAILPGASGLLLLLSGIYGLSLHPLRPAAILAILLSLGLLALSARRPLFGAPALLGTAGLVLGLCTLVIPRPAAPLPHRSIPVTVGLAVGLIAALGASIAGSASRNKRILPSSAPPPRSSIPSPPPVHARPGE